MTITVYGADWCPDCRRSKKFLIERSIPFNWVDTDQDKEAEALVKQLNNGMRIIPTIVFEDGSFITEPSDESLAEKIGIKV
ncbi:MAG TPA: glutaredoxin domain-containing protein [Anaerolineales bacterium]|nr:glutaredoxin domain-containing protein [Anaerolineales bacterium]